MDYTKKYIYLKHQGKDIYKIIEEMMTRYKSPLFAIRKIREIFPQLSLMEAKEVVIIATTEHKSLSDYQKSLFPDLEELGKLLNEEDENENL